MPVGSYCRRPACTVDAQENLRAAAERMEKEGLGMLVAVEKGCPVGVLTDRDVALCALDAATAHVAQAMTRSPATIEAGAALSEAVALMGRKGVRRLPVVEADGQVVGVLAADDLLRLLASEIGTLAAVTQAQLPPGLQPGAPAQLAVGGPSPGEPHYAREVASVRADAPVAEAVEALRERAIGCVVVVGESEEPVGVLTDRDVALRVIARGLDPAATLVSGAMSSPAVTCDASQGLQEVAERMRALAVRRVPIVRDGRLAGIVTFDDLVATFGDELQQLGTAARRQVRREARRAQAEHLRQEAGDKAQEAIDKLQEVGARLAEIGGEKMKALGREVAALRDKLRARHDT
jgi:CBS domain-containing protein